MEAADSAPAVEPPIKRFGFTVKDDGRRPSLSLKPPASGGSSESETWGLPARWKQSQTPFQLEQELHISRESLATSIGPKGFKGFKDCCEAGSFSLSGAHEAASGFGKVEVVGTAHTCAGVKALVKSVVGGLKACQQPKPSLEGLGGTYFFLDERGKKRAIVKPCDEEPMAPNNPKGFSGRALGEPGMKPTVRVGEAALREVAAFLLDHDHFASVPHTVLVRVTHDIFHIAKRPVAKPSLRTYEMEVSSSEASVSSYLGQSVGLQPAAPSKLASLQEFVQHRGDANEVGCSRFSVKDVHRIGILDLRLFNTDRHAGNLLVRAAPTDQTPANSNFWLREQLDLIPIDHGFCLPEGLEPPYLEWLHWPQANIAFEEEELKYIERLDAKADVQFLREELPWLPEGSLRTLQVATLLLKKCAAAGLSLGEIGSVASRPIVGLQEEASQLESVCLAARAAVKASATSREASRHLEAVHVGPPFRAAEHTTAGSLPSRPLSAFYRGASKLQNPFEGARSGDELLFDLEEESSRASGSPMALSRASNPPNLPEEPETSSQEADCGHEPHELLDSSPNSSGQISPPCAQSFTAQPLHNPHGHDLQQRQSRMSRVMKAQTMHAWPPPAAAPSSSDLISLFDGFDEGGWEAFVQLVEVLIQVDSPDVLASLPVEADSAGKGLSARAARVAVQSVKS